MPDNTDLAPQDPVLTESTDETHSEEHTSTAAASTIQSWRLLKDLQSRRDALEAEIRELANRKQQLRVS